MSNYPAGFDSFWERENPDDAPPRRHFGRRDFEKEAYDCDGPEPDPFSREEP